MNNVNRWEVQQIIDQFDLATASGDPSELAAVRTALVKLRDEPLEEIR